MSASIQRLAMLASVIGLVGFAAPRCAAAQAGDGKPPADSTIACGAAIAGCPSRY